LTLVSLAGAVALVGACGGERFTSNDAGGGKGGASNPGSGGAATNGGTRANGGSKSSAGASGNASGGNGEPTDDGSGGDGGGQAGSAGNGNGGTEAGTGGVATDTGGALAGSAGTAAGGKAAGTGGTTGGAGGTLGGSAGKTGGAGGTLGGSSGGAGGSAGKTGGAGGTLIGLGGTTGGSSGGAGGSGGLVVVGGASSGGSSSACELTTGATVLLDEQFSADVFTNTGWARTDTSVTVSGGLFKIASDQQYDDYGDVGLMAMAPIVVEVRMRNVSGGSDEITPVVEVHFGTDSPGVVSITYNKREGYGWVFGPPGVNTGSTIEAPASEGVWTTIRAFLRTTGGTLCAKRDDETGFTLAGSSSWQLPKAITRLRLRQNYDDVSEVDRVTVRQLP
jgi:hypothetical protein